MFKRMTLLRRVPHHTQPQFRAHWAQVHAPLVLRLPGIRRYVQNDIVAADAAYDGIVELWFDDEAALRAAFASAEGRALPSDEVHFLGGKIVCDVEERVIAAADGHVSGAKLLTVLRSDRAADRDAWEEWHAGIAGMVEPADFSCTRMSVHRVASLQRVGSEARGGADPFAFIAYHFTTPEARSSFLDTGRADAVEHLASDASATYLRMTVSERVLRERSPAPRG